MLAKKSLSMGELGKSLDAMPTVIKGEDRGIIATYEDYIFNKTLEADAIIEEAQRTAEHIATEAREQAELQFWQQAQAFYNDLEALKAEIIESVEQQCRDVVVACMQELVTVVPSDEKIKPIIDALLAENINEAPAKLHLHPAQVELMEPYLAQLPVPFVADASIGEDAVLLKSEKSEYKASFQGRLQLLIRALESKSAAE